MQRPSPRRLWLLAALGTALPAQTVGRPAGEITFAHTYHFDGFANQRLSDLRGSAVLVEFWGDH